MADENNECKLRLTELHIRAYITEYMKLKFPKGVPSKIQERCKGREGGLVGVLFEVKRERGDGGGGEEFEDVHVVGAVELQIHSRYMQLVFVPAGESSGERISSIKRAKRRAGQAEVIEVRKRLHVSE